jgi:hypothetical protein
MEQLFDYLSGPQDPKSKDPSARDHFQLREKNFKDNHFTSDNRQGRIQSHIKSLLNVEGLSDLQICESNLSDTAFSPYEKIERILSLLDTLLASEKVPLEFREKCEVIRDHLVDLKTRILREGAEIADTVQSEIQRKLTEQALSILAAVLTFVGSLLFLACPQRDMIGYALCLSSSVLGILNVVYNKGVSQQQFLHITRRFNKVLAIFDVDGVAR